MWRYPFEQRPLWIEYSLLSKFILLYEKVAIKKIKENVQRTKKFILIVFSFSLS